MVLESDDRPTGLLQAESGYSCKKSRKALQNGGKEERERSIKAALPEMEQAGADTRTVLKLMFIGQLIEYGFQHTRFLEYRSKENSVLIRSPSLFLRNS